MIQADWRGPSSVDDRHVVAEIVREMGAPINFTARHGNPTIPELGKIWGGASRFRSHSDAEDGVAGRANRRRCQTARNVQLRARHPDIQRSQRLP